MMITKDVHICMSDRVISDSACSAIALLGLSDERKMRKFVHIIGMAKLVFRACFS